MWITVEDKAKRQGRARENLGLKGETSLKHVLVLVCVCE